MIRGWNLKSKHPGKHHWHSYWLGGQIIWVSSACLPLLGDTPHLPAAQWYRSGLCLAHPPWSHALLTPPTSLRQKVTEVMTGRSEEIVDRYTYIKHTILNMLTWCLFKQQMKHNLSLCWSAGTLNFNFNNLYQWKKESQQKDLEFKNYKGVKWYVAKCVIQYVW